LRSDLDLALPLVKEAGELAMRAFRHRPKWHRKADGTPVTEVDLAIDHLLRTRLMAARPDYGWLSEETADTAARLTRRRLWILDPLDGTGGFLRGEKEFCISLALAEEGRPVLGIIHAPALARTWTATSGGGAFLNGAPVRVSRRETLEGARIIGPASVRRPECWKEPWPPVDLFRPPSLALRLAYVASGEADAMLAPGHKSEWDVAAGDILVREAGGRVTDMEGRPIRYNSDPPRPHGVVAAPAALHDLIMRRLAGYRPPRHGRHCRHRRAGGGT
jgi:myo-inositol-1(or 4)-monophosphatase